MTDPIDFNKEKAKRKKTEKVAKLGRAELYRNIVFKMNRSVIGPDWPEFPKNFHHVSDRAGRKTVLEELPEQVVVYRDRDVVADHILRYCWNEIPWVPGATAIDWQGAAKCRDMWMGMTPALETRPDMLLEQSQPGLCFKRLPFDAPASEPSAPPPHFESLLARMSDPTAVCAFIGSLFYPQADRQQYLYLYGEGGDGKGALMRFLHSVFGDAAMSLTPPPRYGDKFWNFNIYGKRLGLFYDCEDWDWFRSSHLKSLTGGDPIMFEEKGRSGFTDTPAVKFIAASNSKPNVSSQSADMRRLIFVSCLSLPADQRIPHFEELLLSEAPSIISTCKAIYLERSTEHGAIHADQALEVAYEAESYYLDMFNSYFVVAPECSLSGDVVTAKLREFGARSNQELAKIKKVWERLLGIRCKHTMKGRVYVGMGFKGAFSADGHDER